MHFVAQAFETFAGLLKGANNPVDLGLPGVGDDNNFHIEWRFRLQQGDSLNKQP
jgi:hypothetical protein